MCWEVFVLDRNEYLEIVVAQIRCKRAIPYLKEELEDHIQDQKDAYLAEGMNPFEAEMAAVKQMGDPVETGVQLDRVHKPKMEWKIFAVAAFLGLVGMILQISISMLTGEKLLTYTLLYEAGRFIGGMMIMLVICYMDYSILAKHARKLWMILMILLFCMCVCDMSILLRVVNGVNRNAAIVVYFTIPVYAAFVYSYRGKGKKGMLISILNLCLFLMILMTEVSLGFIVLTGTVDVIILGRAICKNWFRIEKSELKNMIKDGIRILAGVLLVFGAVWILNGYGVGYTGFITIPDYYVDRIKIFLSGDAVDYIAGQINLFFRDGSNLSEMPFLLGHIKSDYVWLAIIGQWGDFAGCVIGFVCIVLLAMLFWKTHQQKNQLGHFIALSCTMFLSVEMLFYIGGNWGITPFMGSMFMPFLGDGKVAAIVTYFYMGILLSIFRNTNVVRN